MNKKNNFDTPDRCANVSPAGRIPGSTYYKQSWLNISRCTGIPDTLGFHYTYLVLVLPEVPKVLKFASGPADSTLAHVC